MSLLILVVGIAVVVVVLAPRMMGTSWALSSSRVSVPPAVTIPYPGRLLDETGVPVADGSYQLSFALYEAEAGSEPLWSEVQREVLVKDGAFVTSLGNVNPISPAVLEAGERWLAVAVRGPAETDFTPLAPRQRLSASSPAGLTKPTTGAACPHDHWGETWVGSGKGLEARSNDAFGLIGANNPTGNYAELGTPLEGLHAVAFGPGSAGVFAQSSKGNGVHAESSAVEHSGVYGRHTATGPGVVGRSPQGRGVEGYTTATDPWVPAVYGSNEGTGDGVYGLSQNRHGVFGITESSNPDHAGVFATNHGTGPAMKSEGDLYLTGAFRGNIGPAGGAPYPRPAYDSGWQPIAKGGKVVLNHNLGGNRDNYVVDLQFKNISGEVHNYLYGAMTWAEYLGAWWEDLTSTQITVQRMTDDEWVYQIRVRIWVYR
jgi:hypothetical protein